MAFTEFCCRSGGSNLNAGTRTGSSTEPGTSADFTYASGSWVSATGVFTPASGDPSADGVAVGDFASVYADGATVTTLVGRVTAVSSTTITVSTTAKTGTTTDGTSNRTLKIGGAWKGPNAADWFPISFISQTLKGTAGYAPRINLKNDATYSVTAAGTVSNPRFDVQGYTTAYDDRGRASILGPGTGASFTMLTLGGGEHYLADLIIGDNGSTGVGGGLLASSGLETIERVTTRNIRGHGLQTGGGGGNFSEIEIYNCGQASAYTGFNGSGNLSRVIAFGCPGGDGFQFLSGTAVLTDCIAFSNGQCGFNSPSGTNVQFRNCDAWSNGSHGFVLYRNTFVENCNAIKNGGYGFSSTYTAEKTSAIIRNCGIGSGTQANTSGGINAQTWAIVEGTVTYASGVTPWVDPTTGNFSITLAAAKSAGRFAFLQSQNSKTGTAGSRDIGAAQSAASGGTTLIVIED